MGTTACGFPVRVYRESADSLFRSGRIGYGCIAGSAHGEWTMWHRTIVFVAFAAVSAPIVGAQHAHDAHAGTQGIPSTIRKEHQELSEALDRGTKRTDQIGVAARALKQVLHPHFVREEQIALAPLGALVPLSRGEAVKNVPALVAMTDSLERELPGMLNEHTAIAAAVATLRLAAERARSEEWMRFAAQLAQHAKSEEEILYPAAVVVGRMLRAQTSVP